MGLRRDDPRLSPMLQELNTLQRKVRSCCQKQHLSSCDGAIFNFNQPLFLIYSVISILLYHFPFPLRSFLFHIFPFSHYFLHIFLSNYISWNPTPPPQLAGWGKCHLCSYHRYMYIATLDCWRYYFWRQIWISPRASYQGQVRKKISYKIIKFNIKHLFLLPKEDIR